MREAAARRGAEAILPFCYGGSNGAAHAGHDRRGALPAASARRGSRARCAPRRPAPPTTRSTARCRASPTPTTREAKLIVVWGANPSASGIHLVPVIREAQRRGAALVVVDPRRTPLARLADLHLPVAAGHRPARGAGDPPLLFEQGRADEAFLATHATHVDEFRARAAAWTLARAAEEAGVDAAAIERFARLYAASSPAVRPLRLGPRAQPQRRQRRHGRAGAAGRRRQVRRARRRLLDEQLVGLAAAADALEGDARAADPRGEHEPPRPRAHRVRRRRRWRCCSSTTATPPSRCPIRTACSAGSSARTSSPSSSTR